MMTTKTRRAFIWSGLAGVPLFKTAACAVERACRPTVESQLGPFYREGAPWRTKLCGADEPGEPLVLAGRVTASETCAPLKGAVLDVWHASAAGFYDNNAPSRPFDPAKFFLRGQTKTDADGRYHFETIMPGNYGQGRFVRAKHIHILITCPGYGQLVTECYFEGDKHNATDSLVKSSLVAPLTSFAHEGEKRTYSKVGFDIALVKAG